MAYTADQWQTAAKNNGYTGAFDGQGGLNSYFTANPNNYNGFVKQMQGYDPTFSGIQGLQPTQTNGVLPATVEPMNSTQQQGLNAQAAGPGQGPTDLLNAAGTALAQAGNNYAQSGTMQSNITPFQNGIASSANYSVQPYLDKATQTYDPSTQIQKYENPYQQDVINSWMNEFNRQADMQRKTINDNANSANAFGSTGYGVENALNDERFQELKSNQVANLNDQNYNQAVTNSQNQFNTEAGNALKAGTLGSQNNYQNAMLDYYGGNQAIAGNTANANILNNSAAGLTNIGTGLENLSNTGQSQYYNQAANTLSAGNAIQQQNQNMLNAIEQQRQGQIQFPITQLQNYMNLLKSFPTGNNSTTQSFNASAPYTGAAGGAITGYNLLNQNSGSNGNQGIIPPGYTYQPGTQGTTVPDFSWMQQSPNF